MKNSKLSVESKEHERRQIYPEKERVKADGWNDVSMEYAQIKLVCERCYFEMKDLNLKDN